MAKPSAESLAEVREEESRVARPVLPEAKGLLDSETHSPSSSLGIDSVNAKLPSGTGSPILMQKSPHCVVPKNIHHQTLVAASNSRAGISSANYFLKCMLVKSWVLHL